MNYALTFPEASKQVSSASKSGHCSLRLTPGSYSTLLNSALFMEGSWSKAVSSLIRGEKRCTSL